MEDINSPTIHKLKRPHPHKRSLSAMRSSAESEGPGELSEINAPAPMMIDNLESPDSSSADSGSGKEESFEQVCDRHVRAFLRTNSGKSKEVGSPSTQQGLEHGDRTPSGGVFMEGVPRMLGGGNCVGRGDSFRSDTSSQQDPSELAPLEQLSASDLPPILLADDIWTGNPAIVTTSPRALTLRGGSAELEIVDAAKAFEKEEGETSERQPEPSDFPGRRQPEPLEFPRRTQPEPLDFPGRRQPEPLDLPSSSSHGQAVLDEPTDKEEESPPSRLRQNFQFFRTPETLLSREPPPAPSSDEPGPSTAPRQSLDESTDSPHPTSPQSFQQRVEFLSRQFIDDPPSQPGSSSHSTRSSLDSKPQSSSPEEGPRRNEPVPWRELFDLLPETRGRHNPQARPTASSELFQPGTSVQPGTRVAYTRPSRQYYSISPIASPSRSIVLPGLPDDLAVLCIARVPRAVLPRLICVSKAWAMLIRSEELYKIRGDNALKEPWLYALCESPRYGPWRVYDPVFRRWHILPTPVRGVDEQLIHAKYATIALHEKMLVVGGCYFRSGDPTEGTMLEMDQHALRDIRVYDPVKDRWTWAEQMNEARRSFAIGEIDGKVYVAGGLGVNGELLSHAEVYDPATNRWTLLPPMSVARYGCAGAILHGKLWVYAGRIQTPEEGWKACSSAEVYDPQTATWRTVDEMWMRKDLPNPAAVLDELLYTVDCEDDCKIKCYEEETNTWHVVDRLPLPAEFKHAGSRLVAFNDELYMLGGTIFYRDGDLNRGRNINTVEIFNPKALARGEVPWRSAPNMGDGRGGIWGCAVLSL